MRVLVHTTFAQTEGRTALDVFTSPETPKRPADTTEVASFTFGDDRGVHVLILFDVENTKLADFMNAQMARTTYVTSRADVKTVVHVGYSLDDAIAIAMKHLPAGGRRPFVKAGSAQRSSAENRRRGFWPAIRTEG